MAKGAAARREGSESVAGVGRVLPLPRFDSKKTFLLHGEGGTGKSTFMDILRVLVGSRSNDLERFIEISNHADDEASIKIHWGVPIPNQMIGFQHQLLQELPGIFNWAVEGSRRLRNFE